MRWEAEERKKEIIFHIFLINLFLSSRIDDKESINAFEKSRPPASPLVSDKWEFKNCGYT